ncbi:acyl dehydratase [Pseudomonas sp. OTU5201]|uniref:acyl dehydratase n=1 Tax=Pseudomonas sp. OTU5201 TaxID=3043850 RepID=UPI00313F11BA
MSPQFWEDVAQGDALTPLAFPLSVARLVVAAGANRDFNAIHHNSEYAKATGAPEMYANTLFLQGMWERAVRDFIGLNGQLLGMKGFRMSSFNLVGDTVTVKGEVIRTWREGGRGLIEIRIWSENAKGISVGPGSVIASMPCRFDMPDGLAC